MSRVLSGLSRWGLPLALVWSQLMLSAFVFERRLPDGLRSGPGLQVPLILLAVPTLSAAFLWSVRRAESRAERSSAVADALVAWLLAFLMAAHAIVLAVVVGALGGLHPWLGVATAVLLLGLAYFFPSLPPGSPLGLNLPGRAPDPGAWFRMHLRLARGLAASAGVVLIAATRPSSLLVLAAALPTAWALVWALRTPESAASD